MLPVSEGWERFHPLTPLFSAWRLITLGLLVGVEQVSSIGGDSRLALIAAGAVVLAVVAGSFSYLSWQFAGFRLRDDQLEIRRGILFKSHGNVPVARIESVDIAQNAVPRVFGLAEVMIEVASQAGGEAELRYLAHADALALRRRLDDARQRASGVDPAEVRDAPAQVQVATVADRDLLVAYGLAPVLAVAGIVTVAGGVAATAGVGAVLSFGVVGLLAIGGTVFGQLRRVDRLHGFTISRSEDELHITRGFVEKLTQQIPLDRIQAVRIEAPLIWRRFGRARLTVSVAGYRGSDRADATAILMPVARRDEVERLVISLGGPSLAQLNPLRPPRAARWRAPFWWRHTWIGHAPGFTVTQRGLLTRRTDFVTAPKLQSLRITKGPWQRALGLATLHLDTAGPGVIVSAPHLAASDAERELWIARSG